LHWEILWWNASRIWQDFGLALPFQTRLTQTKPLLPLSNEHGSQVKDQGRRQCCHNEHKKFPYQPTRDVPLLSGHALYMDIQEQQQTLTLLHTKCDLVYSTYQIPGSAVQVNVTFLIDTYIQTQTTRN
jgi:hypothetical protein